MSGSIKYDKIKNYIDEEFRRLNWIKRTTFKKIIEILAEAEKKKKIRGGKPNTLPMEERVLMALEYLREYWISENTCYRNIKWIEDTLIKHPDFALPGKKALMKSDMEYEVMLMMQRKHR